MNKDSSRDKILRRLREAPEPSWEFKSDLLNDDWNGFNTPDALLDSFLSRLESVKGKGFIVADKEVFCDKLKELTVLNSWTNLYNANQNLDGCLTNAGIALLNNEPEKGSDWVAITGCESLIALTGSVMVSAKSGPGRKIHVSPATHIVYAGLSQLHPFIIDGFNDVARKYETSWIGLITGPSRTADIEKTLVLGAHGPKELIVFIDQSC
jgi:L-lactate dehydrogenase complex protein LldG